MRATAPRVPRHLRPVPNVPEPPDGEARGIVSLLGGLLGRLGGGALLVLAAWLALALWGWHADDPSWNLATARPAANPAGALGAVMADVLYQPFGYAAWALVAVLVGWGGRLLMGEGLARWWLAGAAVLPALIAAAAFAAGLDQGTATGLPPGFMVGGFVGEYVFRWLAPRVGYSHYGWLALAAAVPLLLVATGARWRDTLWLVRRMVRGSRWLGREAGTAAAVVGRFSGRRIARGWASAGGRLWRPDGDIPPAEPKPEDAAPEGRFERIGRWLAGHVLRRTGEAPEDAPPAVRRRGAGAPPAGEASGGRERRPRNLRLVEPTPAAPSPGAAAAPLGEAALGSTAAARSFELPSLDLLAKVRNVPSRSQSESAMAETSRQLETVLDDFGVRGEIVDAKPGPVVTLFELEPAPGTRAARVISLADDIARSLSALSVRVAVVPGRNVIGIELPNDQRETVYLRQLLEADAFTKSAARLALALGKDISGNPIIVDLARMPHLLIAGTTGSGKSVAINAMILSLLYRLTPEECRIIMIDPKVIELSVYEGIPHLLAPVVTEPHKAVVALKWVVRQMDERYRLMSHVGVRDIFAFNRRIQQAIDQGEELKRRVRTGFEPGTGIPIYEDQPIPMRTMPLIVVIVDEVADLMLTAGKEIENAIQRLSQKARAAGVHLIVATQRPSVDVLTGVIKANLPSRISFRVSSKIDSRTILGEPGAEQLLGQGDMLHLMPGDRIGRIHGPLVTDSEVERVVGHLKLQGEPDYEDDVTREEGDEGPGADGPLFDGAASDTVYQQAVQIVLKDGKASTSYLQRKLSIGYNSAAKLIERMEAEGVISHADHVGRRQVLMGRGGVDGTELTTPF